MKVVNASQAIAVLSVHSLEKGKQHIWNYYVYCVVTYYYLWQ